MISKIHVHISDYLPFWCSLKICQIIEWLELEIVLCSEYLFIYATISMSDMKISRPDYVTFCCYTLLSHTPPLCSKIALSQCGENNTNPKFIVMYKLCVQIDIVSLTPCNIPLSHPIIIYALKVLSNDMYLHISCVTDPVICAYSSAI